MAKERSSEQIIGRGFSKLLFFTALTPIHPGSGESFSLVDLCIQREKTTGFPFIQSTGLKGVMRDSARRLWKAGDDDERIRHLFGGSVSTTNPATGSFTISDARLLLLPVRSLSGLFAYVTCHYVLNRLKRDAKLLAGIDSLPEVNPNWNRDPTKTFFPENSLSPHPLAATDSQAVLEDLLLGLNSDPELARWAEVLENWIGSEAYQLPNRFLVVHDDVFSHLSEVATAVHHRNRLETDGSKQVATGGLFNQEFLCEYTVMYTVLRQEPVPAEVQNDLIELCRRVWQVGANETTGKGFIQPCLQP
ncbi:MAG: type III-B CRISPR module RAMP protein Cmr4 [Deltaproteobacteria bacterium]|nr:type III-B CRISPR module RAMP protein Cmr4 [Deltaproteobacteria bacterium]